jgi:4a-hydroxytetrahydrobiopterin dehydratase
MASPSAYSDAMTDTTSASDRITINEFRESEGTADWPVVAEGAMTFFATDSLGTSARLVGAIGEIPGIDDHPPGIEIRPNGVTVHLVTAADDFMGMSRRDVELAREISAVAVRLGLRADGSDIESVQPIVIGATDVKRVMPFWAALLGYIRRPDSPDEDLVDPRGRGPGVWFEQVENPDDGRPRMHFAVWVPYDNAQARVDAALAAGGTLVYDEAAPSWWTLADPEGNEADVATTRGRD